jgi:hypothetical protein
MSDQDIVDMDNPFGMPEFEPGEDALERALHDIMATPQGRTLIWHVLGQTKLYDEGFSGNSTDIYDKGKRSVGLWLLAQINEMDPTAYPRMLLDVARQEQRAIQRANQQERTT